VVKKNSSPGTGEKGKWGPGNFKKGGKSGGKKKGGGGQGLGAPESKTKQCWGKKITASEKLKCGGLGIPNSGGLPKLKKRRNKGGQKKGGGGRGGKKGVRKRKWWKRRC